MGSRKNHLIPGQFEAVRGQRLFCLFLGILTALALFGTSPSLEAQVGSAPVDGEIEFLFLDDPDDFWSSGSIVLAGQTIIIPRNLLIDLPANRLTLWQLFNEAPPSCLALGESGLARADGCTRGKGGGYGHVVANQMPDGTFVAGELFLQKGLEVFSGVVSYINYDEGYLRCNGDPADPANTGTMIRINDPDQVHTIQQGLGCDGGPNCSPDPRFTNDPENYTVSFMTGYPMCIPSTLTGIGDRTQGADANGVGDEFCPTFNRAGLVAQDSRYMAPLMVGDHIGAEGNTEVMIDRTTGQEISFLSAHTFGVSRAIHTLDHPSQPDYFAFDEVEWDAPGFSNERSKSLFIMFTTLPASEVNIYALDTDPETGETHERILASTVGNPNAQNHGIGPNGRNIGKTGYDVDFIKGVPVSPRRSPCALLAVSGFDVCPLGGTMEEEFALVSPLTREVIGRTRHKELLDPEVISFNISGGESLNGEYLTPIGIGHPEFDEINLDALATPFIFTGQPWLIDRRLGPGGCQDDDENGLCDSTAPMGELRLDPFPYSALDAISQVVSLPPPNIDRVYHYWPFGPGDSLQAVAETLTLDNFGITPGWQRGPALVDSCAGLNSPPTAVSDTLSTVQDTPLLISSADLAGNDTDPELDLLTVTAMPTLTAFGGTITQLGPTNWSYAPPAGVSGINDFFTYTVSDAHGGSASGQVTIGLIAPTP